MDSKNNCIQCIVDECKYHSQSENFCTLDKILVGKSESTATATTNTDCESFIVKQNSAY